MPYRLISIRQQETSINLLFLLAITINTEYDQKAKDLPIIKFPACNKGANLNKTAFKKIYCGAYRSETEIINFNLQVPSQNVRS